MRASSSDKNGSRLIFILSIISIVSAHPYQSSGAEEITVKPTGEFAQIDTDKMNKALEILKKGSKEEQDKLISEIKATPQNFAPPVLYKLSNVLFDKGDKDDAAFWFYAGQLRGRFDANRCADLSSREAIAVLNMTYGAPINKYALQDIPKLTKLVEQVVEWDEKTPHSYDQRWINLHGMGAMISGLNPNETKKPILSMPENEWDAIAAKTRKDYLNGFQAAMKELERRRQQPQTP